MRHERDDWRQAARGRWKGILGSLGIEERFLKGKHGPCPVCAGTDRFRFDDKDGNGTSFCGGCGARDGLGLVMAFKGVDFKEALALVRPLLGLVDYYAPKPELTEEKRRALLRDLWTSSRPVAPGDVVDRYLTARGVGEKAYPAALRTVERCRFAEGVHHPALVAVVSDRDGKAETLHRTYLAEGRKADVPEPRKLMPGAMPKGGAIRLSEPGPVLGIAEGIETALAASNRFEVPVWAAVNAQGLADWEPPQEAEEVIVFADNDPKFGGQRAAYLLAHRLATRKDAPRVRVHLAPEEGKDWADYAGDDA